MVEFSLAFYSDLAISVEVADYIKKIAAPYVRFIIISISGNSVNKSDAFVCL